MSIEKFQNYKGIEEKDIPKIPLYMDQVTSWFDEAISNWAVDEAEKTLTKTMINNYVKAKLVSAPEKKKYTPEQLMQLVMIYHLKNVLTIDDLRVLFRTSPNGKTDLDLAHYYNQFHEMENFLLDELRSDGVFSRLSSASVEDKRLYALQLSLEANLKKRLAEILIDSL